MTSTEIITLDLEDLSDSFLMELLTPASFTLNQFYRLSFNQFILFKKGKGRIQIDGTAYVVAANSLLLIGKNQVYTVTNEEDLTGYSLCFDDLFWERTPVSSNNCKATLFNNISDNQHIQPLHQDVAELSGLFQRILAEYDTAPYINKADVLAAFLKIVMIKIANINSLLVKVTGQHDDKIYYEFIDLLEREEEISHDVSYFADKLNISSRKLTELCRKYAGKGAKDIIQAYLIAEAKRSLQFTSGSIKEIAFSLNFSPYQFSHFFKKNTSLSPETYRKRAADIDI